MGAAPMYGQLQLRGPQCQWIQLVLCYRSESERSRWMRMRKSRYLQVLGAANGIEYNIGNYCNAITKPISTGADEAPPAPETATRKKHMIKATGTDFCFDLRNSGTPKDDALVINPCDKSELSQIFIVESRDKGVGDIVKFRSFLEPELCLQPISDIARKRTLLQLADCEGLTNEVWRLENRDGSGAIRNLPLGPDANSFCLVPRGLPEEVGANSGMVLKKCKKAMHKGMIYQYTLVEV